MKRRAKKSKKEKVKRKGTDRRKIKGKQEKQIRFAVVVMVGIILLVIFIGFAIQRTKKFEYAGLEFIKVKQGELQLYYTKFPVVDLTGNVIGYVPFYFRKDPRKLNDIDIDGNIILKKKIAIAIDDSFVRRCEDSALAATTLGLFLQSTEIESFGATTNKTEAELLGRRYVTCGDANTILLNPYSVIEFREGGENSVNRINSDCYALYVSDCKVIEVVERFMLGLYAQSRGIEI